MPLLSRRSWALVFLSFCLPSSYRLMSQQCDELTINSTLEYASELIQDSEKGVVNEDELKNVEEEIESFLKTCMDGVMAGKDTLEYKALLHLYKISEAQANIEKMVTLLTRLSRKPDNIVEGFNPEAHQQAIDQIYAPMRIRYVGEDMTTMAVIKSIQDHDTSNVLVELLAPLDAWRGNINQKAKQRRIQLITKRSRDGNFPLYFDSYDEDDGYFYFEIPYVPVLLKSPNSAMWYAITFDGRKRYRMNFYSIDQGQKQPALQLEPMENWLLVKQIPEKYVMFKLDRNKRVQIINKQTGKRLRRSEYILIERGTQKEYYLLSNNDYRLEISTPANRFFQILNKGAGLTALILFSYSLKTIAD